MILNDLQYRFSPCNGLTDMRSGQTDQAEMPDGISQQNIGESPRANPIPLLLLATLLGLGLASVFGGQPSRVTHSMGNQTHLSVKVPHILRNGVFFETVIEVRADRQIEQLAIAVSDPLWRDMTINTMIPAASEESYKRGAHIFSFGKLEAGESFRFKIDGQINPPLFAGTRGEIAAFDGDRKLVATPVVMRVLP